MKNFCRDYWNEEAEIWQGAELQCAHCRKTWWGIFVRRHTSFCCPHCDLETRKKVVREL